MNMRDRNTTDSVDITIGRSLKAWAGGKKPPVMGRILLMQATAASAVAPARLHARRRQGLGPHRPYPSEWSGGWPRQAMVFWFLGDVQRLWLRC
jgi:hypothetical protein